MANSGFESMREGMFRYAALIPPYGLHWDDELQPSDIFTEHPLQRKQELLKPPWLVGPIAEFGSNTPPEGKIISPFSSPGLFRRFARLTLTCKAIEDFANKYGFLGSLIPLHYLVGTDHTENKLKFGEPFLYWKEEIGQMRLLVDLWDDVLGAERGGSAGSLASQIRWGPPGVTERVLFISRRPPNGSSFFGETITDGRIWPQGEVIKQWKHNDFINPARYYLNQKIDAHLRGHINPSISPDSAYMDLDCLLAALYLSFKWEVSGKKLPMQCPQCKESFTPTRPNQKYCNKKCTRNASWHLNKEKWRKRTPKNSGPS